MLYWLKLRHWGSSETLGAFFSPGESSEKQETSAKNLNWTQLHCKRNNWGMAIQQLAGDLSFMWFSLSCSFSLFLRDIKQDQIVLFYESRSNLMREKHMDGFINWMANINALLAVSVSGALWDAHLHICILIFKEIMKYLKFLSAITDMSAWHICLLI